jgi:hypothetical protein
MGRRYTPSSGGVSAAGGFTAERLAQLTWRNKGTATAEVIDGVLLVTPPPMAGDNLRCLEEPVPAGAWKYRAKLAHVGTRFNYASTGLYLIDSATGRLVVFLISIDSSAYHMGISRYTNVNTWNASSAIDSSGGGSLFHGQQPRYYEVERTAGNLLVFRYSQSGIEGTYLTFLSESHTAWLTNGPSHIGLLSNCNTASGYIGKSLFYSFDRVA